MAERIKIKARPVIQRIKIQYEGEELTIRELIERLEDVQAWRKHWKELAMRQDKQIDELRRQLTDAQTVRHGRWIDRTEAYNDVPQYSCSQCGFVHIGLRTRFCPECGAKMDGGEEDGV